MTEKVPRGEEWFEDPITGEQFSFIVVDLEEIQQSELNSRDLKQDHVTDLQQSMRHHGQLVPGLGIMKANGDIEVEALGGKHRANALQRLQEEIDGDVTMHLKVYPEGELSEARKLEIARVLNERRKPNNKGEQVRHVMKERRAMRNRMQEAGEPINEKALAKHLGDTKGKDKKLFIIGPIIDEARSTSKIAPFVCDSQTPASEIHDMTLSDIRNSREKGILTVGRLLQFLNYFVHSDLQGAQDPDLRDHEVDNALRLLDRMTEVCIEPLWHKDFTREKEHATDEGERMVQEELPHQHAINFVRTHPFKAFGSVLSNLPQVFDLAHEQRGVLYTKDETLIDWQKLDDVLEAARDNVPWAADHIRNERSLSSLSTRIQSGLVEAL